LEKRVSILEKRLQEKVGERGGKNDKRIRKKRSADYFRTQTPGGLCESCKV